MFQLESVTLRSLVALTTLKKYIILKTKKISFCVKLPPYAVCDK